MCSTTYSRRRLYKGGKATIKFRPKALKFWSLVLFELFHTMEIGLVNRVTKTTRSTPRLPIRHRNPTARVHLNHARRWKIQRIHRASAYGLWVNERRALFNTTSAPQAREGGRGAYMTRPWGDVEPYLPGRGLWAIRKAHGLDQWPTLHSVGALVYHLPKRESGRHNL